MPDLTDRIELRGLQVAACCGVLPEERERAQPLEIDVDIEVDLSRAGQSDDLHDTIDYGAVCATIESVCAEGAPHLLEHLAATLVERLLHETGAERITLSVRKLRPPVPQLLATSGVRISRSRSDRSS